MELPILSSNILFPTKHNKPDVTRHSANFHQSISGVHFLKNSSNDKLRGLGEKKKCLRKMELRILGSNIRVPTKNNKPDVTRRSANFRPSIWGDYFLKYSSNDKNEDPNMAQRLPQMKENVINMLLENVDDHLQKMNLIDAIQRLGVSYHFDNEIDMELQKIYETTYQSDHYKANDADLYTTSLWFRLLRQQGYHVSSDMFEKFKDCNRNFKENLKSDVRGLLSLYEATHLRVRGEDILDEALVFTENRLKYALPNLSNPLKEQVSHALEQPIRTGVTRIEARAYISFYGNDNSHDRILLQFAKINFNELQKMHQKELSEITRWWIDLDFANKLPYARDRIVECYFWILGVCFEPEYVLVRRMLSKVVAMISIIDDTYDVYGTLEELELFTDAVDRWDINVKDQLPEYMQICYKALIDIYIMIEEEMAKHGKSYRVHYAKEVMKDLVKAYFEEAKWCNRKYVPTYEEYMKVALVTCSYKMLVTTTFVVMGDVATRESLKLVSNGPLIVRASSVIFRLQDDMVGHKFEQKREHVASAVECYMKQHRVSEEEVYSEFQKQVTNAWKDINAEFVRPTKVPIPLLTRMLNWARVINVIYKDEDGYTHSGAKLEGFIESVLIDPVPI